MLLVWFSSPDWDFFLVSVSTLAFLKFTWKSTSFMFEWMNIGIEAFRLCLCFYFDSTWFESFHMKLQGWLPLSLNFISLLLSKVCGKRTQGNNTWFQYNLTDTHTHTHTHTHLLQPEKSQSLWSQTSFRTTQSPASLTPLFTLSVLSVWAIIWRTGLVTSPSALSNNHQKNSISDFLSIYSQTPPNGVMKYSVGIHRWRRSF